LQEYASLEDFENNHPAMVPAMQSMVRRMMGLVNVDFLANATVGEYN